MLHEVYIETPNTYAVYSYKNESIAMQVFEAAMKWGKLSFVLSYTLQ